MSRFIRVALLKGTTERTPQVLKIETTRCPLVLRFSRKSRLQRIMAGDRFAFPPHPTTFRGLIPCGGLPNRPTRTQNNKIGKKRQKLLTPRLLPTVRARSTAVKAVVCLCHRQLEAAAKEGRCGHAVRGRHKLLFGESRRPRNLA